MLLFPLNNIIVLQNQKGFYINIQGSPKPRIMERCKTQIESDIPISEE